MKTINKLNPIINLLKQKKVQNTIIIILFLTLLIGASWIRLQNLPLLVDSTTGKNIPLALDPFYILRMTEAISEGGLPEIDRLRYPALQIGFSTKFLPIAVVFLHQVASVFSEVTLQYIFVISPVIFFILGLITFFFLILVLTNKWIALISSIFLAIIPTYLYRTMAGFTDNEAIGMFAFFLCLLSYSLAIKYIDREKSKSVLFGFLVGFPSAFTIFCWAGISNFVFMILPLSFLLFWLIKGRVSSKKSLFNFVIFYSVWFSSSILFSLVFGFNLSFVLNKVFLSSGSILNGFVLLFIIVDFCIVRFGSKILSSKEKLNKYRVIVSTLIVSILGIIFLSLSGTNIFSFIPGLFNQLLHPFGAGRTGQTVAENASPYLMTWINQIGKMFFWIFYLGIVFLGIEISKGIGKTKNKVLFSLSWIIMISGILFSRISATSSLNGNNFLSQFVYFGSLLIFFGYCVYLYFNDDIKVKSGLLVIFSWLFFMLIAGRGAIRLLFLVTPIICFMGGYAIIKLIDYTRKSKDVLRFFLSIALILVIIGGLISAFNFTNSINNQAKYMGPSANYQWQNAMSWVRDNTPQGSIFVHWWDYGYWVQYLGERPTITDGGHAVGYWDHLIGRYLLTTPNPETALSLMKTHNVSYLLIDQTDLGKYPAYSKIGSDNTGMDRFSGIMIMQSDPKQMIETSDGTTFVYVGGIFVDEDIVYELNEKQIFLPMNKASIGGILLETENNLLKQPIGVFFYNDNQFNIPLRYIYVDNKLLDFKNGLDSVVSIIPKISQVGQELRIDNFGTAIYLSPKVSKSLFAQLYLLDDAFNNYPTLKVAHAEQDISVRELNNQGANLDELIYYQGFRGPIKIWEVDYHKNTIIKEEFLRRSGEYAEFDNFPFVK